MRDISKSEGHYFHFAAIDGRVPVISVESGNVTLWLRQGRANGEKELVASEPISREDSGEIPFEVDEDKIYALFVGTDFRAKYDLKPNRTEIMTGQRKSSLTAEDIRNEHGRFIHESLF